MFPKDYTMKDHEYANERTTALIEMTSKFCGEHLDDDYKHLCIKMIEKMSRKRNIPFLSGRIEIWASAIIYAIGSINFLFDKSFKPFVTGEDIAKYFNTSKSTTAQKAKVIRDMFKLQHYDSDFSTTHRAAHNPMKDMVMINGFIVNKNSLPIEAREYVEMELLRKKR